MALTLKRICQMLSKKQATVDTTLLDIVWETTQLIDDDQQVVAKVAALVNTGQVRLIGTFKNVKLLIG